MPEPGKILPCRGVPTHLRCHGDVPRGAVELLLQVGDKTSQGPLREFFCPAVLSTVSLNNRHSSTGTCRANPGGKAQREKERVYNVDVCLGRKIT